MIDVLLALVLSPLGLTVITTGAGCALVTDHHDRTHP